MLAALLRDAQRLFALPGVQHVQNIHPLVVHFPVALLPAAALVYWLAFLARREAWQWTGLWLLILGVLGAGAAVASGWYAAPGVMLAPSVKENLLVYHKWIMVATLALSTALVLWAALARPMPRRWRGLFLVLLLVMVGVAAKGADYGARMVYDYNAGGYACSQPIEFSQ
ncbi:MAG TPA: DUF2231 domain-containing protein [Candidatus Binataceae bacterium]|nr:DUF2231 domain-containing protein [Candidatus Binataceae bacterium]